MKKDKQDYKKEIENLTKQLEQGVSDYINSDRYKELLDALSKFHNYSLNNSLLIQLQRPDSSLVGSYTTWKRLNRQVKKDEKGIAILCPSPFKTEKLIEKLDDNGNPMYNENGPIFQRVEINYMTYRLGHVFDISQTKQIEGKKEYPLTYNKELTFDVKDYSLYVEALKETSPVLIEINQISSNAKGYYSDIEQKIVIQKEMSQAQTIKTMIHEIAHAYLHNHTNEKFNTCTFSVAECIEFPGYGALYEDLTLKEAIDLYETIDSHNLNAGKGIGIVFHDESIYSEGFIPIVQENKILIDTINEIPYCRENFEVQKAIMHLKSHFNDDGLSLRSEKELQAESIAYIVSKHLGLDTSEYSFGYIASWSKNEKSLRKELETIKSGSNEIIKNLDDSLMQLTRKQYGINNEKDLAIKIDRFMKEWDPYEYADQEIYAGSNYDQIFSSIRKGDTSEISNYFKKILDEDISSKESEEIEQIMKCLETFEKDRESIMEEFGKNIEKRGIEL